MDGHHVHIVLNHFPVVGVNFGLLCLALSMVVRSNDLRRLALGIFVLIALLAIPVYLTGRAYLGNPRGKLITSLVLGIVSGIGIAGERRQGRLARGLPAALLLMALAASGTLAWTANAGGKIRRPEIRYDGEDMRGEPLAGAETRGAP